MRKGKRLLSTAGALLLAGPLGLQLTAQRPVIAAATTSLTFSARADAYVDSSNPANNFGIRRGLKTDAAPVVRSFLRFHVNGTAGSVVGAQLKVYATSANTAGYAVRRANNTAWGETSITYRNAPEAGSVVGTSSAVTKGSWSAVDVTPAVTGDGLVTLVMNGRNGSETRFRSREGARPPALVVDVSSPEPSPSPNPSPTVGPTFPPPIGSASDSSGWLVTCGYSHSLPDDPIVAPGQAGGSHHHDFLANITTNADSTYGSMIAGGATCTETSGDTAGYWTPALSRNGADVKPIGGPPSGTSSGARQQFYYRNNLSGYLPSAIETIPQDLRMIAGNAKAQSEADSYYLGREIYWGCSDNSTGKLKAPPSSCSTGIITLHVGFPNCWDGVHVDSLDHKSHMSYPVKDPVGSYVCPTTHPVPIPRVIMRLEYPVGTDTGTISLASGPPYTAHGDFWNTWVQSRLNQLVSECINKGLDCGKV
jgi:hypothetical protein